MLDARILGANQDHVLLGRKFRSTETTRTLNGSGFVPWKTVSASPTIPGCTSESGMIAGGGPAGTTARSRVPPLLVEAVVAGAAQTEDGRPLPEATRAP